MIEKDVVFFWGRESDGSLKYYDDYNQPGPGYHHEEWYVAVRHAKPGTCSWSESYMDPYSYQPMVTCTVATFDQDAKFSGTVTIDLKLHGLQELADSLQKQTGGYVFILDRNNKFITFPEPTLVKKITQENQGSHTEEFIFASDFAKKSPLFTPLSEAFTAMNQNILKQASQDENYDPNIAIKIRDDSYQIDQEKADLLSAVFINPLKKKKTELYQKMTLENDFFLNEPSTAFIFHIPESYWKLVIVKPNVEINAVANKISEVLILYLLAMTLVILGITYFVFLRKVAKPLIILSRATHKLGQGDISVNKQHKFYKRQDEMGAMGREMDALTHYLKSLIDDMVQVSHGLSVGNLEITPKATYKGEFIQIENAILKLVDATKQNALQDWVKTGQAQLNEIMSGEQSMEMLSKNIISFLTTYIDAQIGLFYLAGTDLHLIASYGYTDTQAKHFDFGEGLVGQAAKEQKTICRTYTKKEWQFIIQSGFARAVPHQVILVPILYEKNSLGVIEIGLSEEALTSIQQTFLEHAMLSIGIAVNTTANLIKEKG